MDTTTNEQTLRSAVEHLYAVFGRYGPLKTLEACTCDVCMSLEDRDRLLVAPIRTIPNDVLAHYTSNAWGVPDDTDELKILLPRYLDLLAEGSEPELYGAGTVLMRFGDAVRADPAFYTEEERAALMTWMRAFVARVGEAEASAEEPRIFGDDLGIAKILSLLICGGFPAEEVLPAMTDTLLADGFGQAATGKFVLGLAFELQEAGERAGVGWFALQYAPKEERVRVAEWLNQAWWPEHIASIETSHDLDEWDAASFRRARAAFGSFDERLFAQPSWFGVEGRSGVESVSFPPAWDTQFEENCYRAMPAEGAGQIELHFLEKGDGFALEEDGTLERLIDGPLPPREERTPRSLFGAGGFVAEWQDGETWRLLHVAEHPGGAVVASAAHRGEGLGRALPGYQACAHMHRLHGGARLDIGAPLNPPSSLSFPATVVSELDGQRVCSDEAALHELLGELRIHTLGWVVFDRAGSLWKSS